MENVYTENYKGYEIEIIQDADAQNPFEDLDSNPPIAVLSFDYGRSSITEYATQYGNVNNAPDLTREEIKANIGAILSLTDSKTLFALVFDNRSDYAAAEVVDCVNNAISEYVDGLAIRIG